MFYYLRHLSDYFSPLNVFQYVTFRSVGAALTAFIVTLLIGPWLVKILTRLKMGQPIRGADEVHKLAELHDSKKGTPTMGGVLILASVFSACLLWARLDNAYLWIVLVPMFLLGFLGGVDDFRKIRKKKGISARKKLLGQIVIAAMVGAFLLVYPETSSQALNLHLPFLKEPVVFQMGWVALFFIMLVIVGASNGVNLTDGLDGLAIGCTTSVTCVYGVFAYVCSHAKTSSYLLLPWTPGAQELTVFCAALAGAGLGFLWYNCHPAKIFMGDTGSLAIGGAIGIVAVCVHQELLLILVGGIFVIEALSVILQVGSFKLTGRRIFTMAPLHHHFELRGWSETTVVVRFWILSLIFALAGLATLKLR